ncbi:hypothetical protein [Cellulophaga sp. L1A9]|uniref:hypothetical protein n=1 Tax=Cellulophaga sp. L1A9 TaxID=2686362 RepID=UPI00131CB36C|nr:hypothetical protein [Cellulophaga sp. L1A9]
MTLRYFFVFCLFAFSNCKEEPDLKGSTTTTNNTNTQNSEIRLIGIGETSGMTNPNYIKEQYTLIILRDSIYKIKSFNIEDNSNFQDTILRMKNEFFGKNIFEMISKEELKSKTIGSFGVNEGKDWLIAIETKSDSIIIWRMGKISVPKEFEEFNNTIKEIW